MTDPQVSRRQHEILCIVMAYRLKHGGLSPTLAEIAVQLELSRVTVFEHVQQLIIRGLVTKVPFMSRSIRLTRRAQDMVRDFVIAEIDTQELKHWKAVAKLLHKQAQADRFKTHRKTPALKALIERSKKGTLS